jgi:hypothetical protein
MMPQPQPQQAQPQVKPSQASRVKQDFAQFVSKASTMINSPQTRQQTLAMLRGSDPARQIARGTVVILQQIDTLSRKSGIEILYTVKVVGAYVIVEQLYQLAAVAGFYKLEEAYRMLALSIAVQDYIKAETQAGRINAKQLAVQVQRDMRAMPPEQRKMLTKSMQASPQVAKRYNKEVREGKFANGGE